MSYIQAFSVLGITGSITKAELKKLYRKLAKEHHPDVGGTQENFNNVAEAYNLLNSITGDLIDYSYFITVNTVNSFIQDNEMVDNNSSFSDYARLMQDNLLKPSSYRFSSILDFY